MYRNCEIFIGNLKLKKSLKKEVENLKFTIENIKYQLYSKVASPSKTEDYIDKDGNVNSWIPPRCHLNIEAINDNKEVLLHNLKIIEKTLKVFQVNINEINETMLFIKANDIKLYNILNDLYIVKIGNEKIKIKYGFNSIPNIYKYVNKNVEILLKNGNIS